MTNFENTVKAVIDGDARARDRFNTAIEAQRMANWNLRNGNDAEAANHNAHYREDMRYVARRVANVTGYQHGLVCDALVIIATEEIGRRGALELRTA